MLDKEVSDMCNLSKGITEESFAEGFAEGFAKVSLDAIRNVRSEEHTSELQSQR